MIFRIDATNSIPVYAQIVEQVKRAVASGAMGPGDALPSLRELALKLRINPLTINRAYKQLENDGLVESRHGLGTFVCANVGNGADGFRRETLTRAIDDLIVDACHLGVPLEELKALLEERMQAARNGFAGDYVKERDGHDS